MCKTWVMSGLRDQALAFLALGDEEGLLGLEELRGAHQVLQLVMDHIPEMIFWKDRSSVYLGCNEVFCDNAGLSHPREIVGKTDYDLPWASSEGDAYRDWDEAVMASGEPHLNIQERQLTADGRHIWVETNKVPLRDSGGRVVGMLGTAEDITDRKLAEEALQKAVEELDDRVTERTKEVEAQRWEADVLRESAALMARSLHFEDVLDAVVVSMKRLFPEALVAVVWFGDDGLRLERIDDSGSPVEERQAVGDLLESAEDVGRYVEGFVDGSYSVVRSPVVAQGRTLCDLVVASSDPDSTGYRQLGVIADLASTALSNATSHLAARDLAVLQERQRIARDLHDAVSQTLWTSSLIAETMVSSASDPSIVSPENLVKLHDLNRGALSEMRMLLLELRPEAIATTRLDDVLAQLLEAFSSRTQILIVARIAPVPPLGDAAKIALYRIAQEALNNVGKHAKAATVTVELFHTPSEVVLRVADDGQGFRCAESAASHGLVIMRERAHAVGATFEVSSQKDAGVCIAVTLPIGDTS